MPLFAVRAQLTTVLYVDAASPAAAVQEVRENAGGEFDLQSTTGFGAQLKAASLADSRHLYPRVLDVDGEDTSTLHLRWVALVGGDDAIGVFALADGTPLASIHNDGLLGTGKLWSVISAQGEILALGVHHGTALRRFFEATALPESYGISRPHHHAAA
ncbi:hypothetical protein [Streptacidiphilus sp. EB103A]|uniref:hypothetical protein n=1 Tax=Streptacidiphilus sp. EB103A TaxID=3156275 RepID=UPI0035150FB1